MGQTLLIAGVSLILSAASLASASLSAGDGTESRARLAPDAAVLRARLVPGERVVLAGRFDAGTIPYRVRTRAGLKNEEMLFVSEITSAQALEFDGTNVALEGRVAEGPGQFSLEVSRIRAATPAEASRVFLEGF